MKHRNSYLSCLLLSVTLFLYSCNTSNSGNDIPPELPSTETMTVDMSEMESVSNKAPAKMAESNFNTALIAVGVAKIILEANLAIPKALVSAAQNATVESTGDAEWEWNYVTAANGQNFGVMLTASIDNSDKVNWNFYVTNSSLGIEDVLFFTGTSDREGNSGTWTYFDLSTQSEVSTIEWERTENEVSIRLDVESDRNDNLGDYITYDFDGTIKSVTFFDASENNTSIISFNTETSTGFIISPNYNEGAKSCWDENLNNIMCTS